MANTKPLYVGLKGTVMALDRSTGRELWRRPLKGSDLVNVILDDDELYAATKGELFRLDPRSGAVIWNNPMPGLGWGMVTIGSAGSQAVVLAEKKRKYEKD